LHGRTPLFHDASGETCVDVLQLQSGTEMRSHGYSTIHWPRKIEWSNARAADRFSSGCWRGWD